MFPNVRLLIGALFIAVLVLSCEFGVFAALRVNREPLSRLTAESAPLQLTAGNSAQPGLTTSWAAPHEAPAPPDISTAATKAAAAPTKRVIKTPVPATGNAVASAGDEVTAAAAQSAPLPAPAAAPMHQAPAPAANAVAAKEPAQAQPAASAAPVQSASTTAAGPGAGETAAPPPSPAAAPAQQTPASAAIAPAQAQPAQPAQPAPEPQAHQSVAKAGEPAADAPVAAAAAAVAPSPTQPAEITGSLPNTATPNPALSKAVAPHGKTAPKVAHKPAAKVRKVQRKPPQIHRVAKKRIARRARAPAAGLSGQPAATFDNPVFASAPQFQSPAKKQPRAKRAATNNGFGSSFGTH